MIYKMYSLPEINFIGGSSEDLQFNLYSNETAPEPFNLYGGKANFSIVNFINKNSTPVLSKQMEIASSGDQDDNQTTIVEELNFDPTRKFIKAELSTYKGKSLPSTQKEFAEFRDNLIKKAKEDEEFIKEFVGDADEEIANVIDAVLRKQPEFVAFYPKYNVIRVSLESADTVDLSGKFVYQIILTDVDGNVDIPHQGIINIHTNINKTYTKSNA